ncbi:hypothetical protein KR222_010920 [Zaprionus bogoriensis]|nr:hypothetical protein KR222_010920 [Zaprionus bogoriensis]
MNAAAGHSSSSKLALGLLNFVLAVSSGWALKHYSSGTYTLAAYGLFFAHSVFCILRYTHPNPGQLHRCICEQSLRYAPTIFVTLIVGQLQSIAKAAGDSDSDSQLQWRSIVLGLYAGIFTVGALRCCLSEKSALGQLLARLAHWNRSLCVLWNIYCLWQVAVVDEYWWSLGLALLVLLNHFVLWRLTQHFNISLLEVDTVGMCFTLIFAINATQELSSEHIQWAA